MTTSAAANLPPPASSVPPMPPNRGLTDEEKRVLNMLYYFEDLAEARRLFGSFTIPEAALNLCQAMGVATPMRVERDRGSELFFVRFSLPELCRYVHFVCKHVGFTIGIDGIVTTKDGIIINRQNKTK